MFPGSQFSATLNRGVSITPTPVAGTKRQAEDSQDRNNAKRIRGDASPHDSVYGQAMESTVGGPPSMAPPPKRGAPSGVASIHMQSVAVAPRSVALRPPYAIIPRAPITLMNGKCMPNTLAPTMAPRATTDQRMPEPFPSLRQIGYHATGIDPEAHPYSYRSFSIGAVIYCKHHVTAQDPGADPLTNTNFVQVPEAIVCSKDRLGVVANVHGNGDIFILPSATHSGKDLRRLPQWKINEYFMVLRDDQDHKRPNPTAHRALDVVMHRGISNLGRNSSICLTEGFTIKHNEVVSFVGQLTDQSTKRMLRVYSEVQDAAVDEYFARENAAREDERRELRRRYVVEVGRDSVLSLKRCEGVAQPLHEADDWSAGSDSNL